MNGKVLTTLVISTENLKRRPFRTACLILLIAMFSFVLFGGSILVISLENGIDSMAKRLGADILVVPNGYDQNIQGALLRGEPSSFYMDDKIIDRVARVNGVKEISPQLYIASLSADCCSLPTQLIGFDPQTDFAIYPWVTKRIHGDIHDGEIVIGKNVGAGVGDVLKFFNREYRVVARLDSTGMGFDTSIFMNMATARQAITDYKTKTMYTSPALMDKSSLSINSVSSILVKVKSGYDVSDVASNIREVGRDKGIDTINSKNMISSISGNLNHMLFFICVLAIILLVLTVGVLAIVFMVALNERKREFSTLRVLGATRAKLIKIVLGESMIISLLGAAIGIAFVCLFLFPFTTYINISLKMPYLLPPCGITLILLFISLLISFTSGPIAAIYSAIKIGKSETYTLMREDE